MKMFLFHQLGKNVTYQDGKGITQQHLFDGHRGLNGFSHPSLEISELTHGFTCTN